MSEYTLAQAIEVIEGMGDEALAWLRALPAETTPEEALVQADSDWVERLLEEIPACLFLLAEYVAKRDVIWAEYVAKRDVIWAEYKVKLAPILAEYDAERDVIWAEYKAKADAIWAEYVAKRDAIWVEYKAKAVPIIIAEIGKHIAAMEDRNG